MSTSTQSRFSGVQLLILFAALLGPPAPPAICDTAPSARPAVRLLSDSIVDAKAMTFEKGRWGTAINGQSYQQEAVVSHRGWQYTTYFADDGVLAVARRKLPDGVWQAIRFPDYALRKPFHNDVHNVPVIGICEGDGTIHLAFDHHNSPLHYRRSVAGLASNPEQSDWKAEQFGAVTSELEKGKPIKGLSYPLFVPVTQAKAVAPAKLQMFYRLGGSGEGDWHLAEYDPGPGAWSSVGMVLSRAGVYEGSENRCAYINAPRYGADGRLHLTWCWRESPELASNHDFNYAWSGDQGRTWKNMSGDTIASLGAANGDMTPKPISIDTPGIRISRIPLGWGQMNQLNQFVDSQGRLHALAWEQPADAAGPSKDLNTWKYVHRWLGKDNIWQTSTLPIVGRKPLMTVDRTGTAYVIFRRAKNANYHVDDSGGTLVVAAATEASQWKDWQVVWESKDRFIGEPLFDLARWQQSQVLAIYAQQEPQAAGKVSALRVVELGVSEDE